MKSIIKSHQNYILNLGIVLFLLISVGVVIRNRGLYFSEFNDRTIIEFQSDAKFDDNVSKIKTFGKISRIDRLNNSVTIEKTSFNEVSGKATEQLSQEETPYKLFFVTGLNFGDSITDLSKGLLVIVLSATLSIIYFALRKNKQINSIHLAKYIAIYLSSAFLGSALSFGLLSILSTFYQIKVLELNLIVLNTFITTILFVSKAVEFTPRKEIIFPEIVELLKESANKNLRITAAILLLILAPLIFGLGPQFLVPAIIIAFNTLASLCAVFIFSRDSYKIPNFIKGFPLKNPFKFTRNSKKVSINKAHEVDSRKVGLKKINKPYRRMKKQNKKLK